MKVPPKKTAKADRKIKTKKVPKGSRLPRGAKKRL